jgi:hypothetical protein
MELIDPIWFSPINVLYHYARLEQATPVQKRKSRNFKKATEARHVAIMLMGIMKWQDREYWMQIVKDSEGSPDIRTGTLLVTPGSPKELKVQEVEVKEFEEHSSESLSGFLKKILLAPDFSYPSTTTILVKVSKTIKFSPKKIFSELKEIQYKNPVIILGKMHPKRHIYKISQVFPTLEFEIDFDVMEEAQKRKRQGKYHGVMKRKRGTDDQFNLVYLPDEKHYPFESLGFSK